MLYEYMKSLGYNDDGIKEIRNAYVLRKYSDIGLYNKINDIFCYLYLFGYSKEDIIKMTVNFPSIYGYSVDSIKDRLLNIIGIGYSKEDVIKMTRKMPSLFGRDVADIRRKKKFYDMLNIGDIIIKDPVHLSQSIELSFARYVFYHRIGIKIDRGNARMLFMRQDSFVKKYGKTNQQLIALYNYDEYLEKQRSKLRKKSS